MVDITIKNGGSIVYQGRNNDLALGFRLSYTSPVEDRPGDYTSDLGVSKAQVSNTKYTNGVVSTTLKIVKRPQIALVELKESLTRYRYSTVYRRGGKQWP